LVPVRQDLHSLTYTTLFRSSAKPGPNPGTRQAPRTWPSSPRVADSTCGVVTASSSGATKTEQRSPTPPTILPAQPPSSTRCSPRSEEHTSELQSREKIVCRL